MTFNVEISHRLDRFTLDVHFKSEGGVTALFGRSGAGKTSVVNVVSGLIRPDHGRVVVDGKTLVDTERGVFVAPHRRRIGYVFQESRLFPHLTVRQNLLYGQWFAPRAERNTDLGRIVDLFGIGHLLDRRPRHLSGGEKQRVAIGRGLLACPRLLLMDEPLAALDDLRKADILPYIERLRDETQIPIVYVSHSVAEVARLASTVIVLADGRVAAAGPANEALGPHVLPSLMPSFMAPVPAGTARDGVRAPPESPPPAAASQGAGPYGEAARAPMPWMAGRSPRATESK